MRIRVILFIAKTGVVRLMDLIRSLINSILFGKHLALNNYVSSQCY